MKKLAASVLVLAALGGVLAYLMLGQKTTPESDRDRTRPRPVEPSAGSADVEADEAARPARPKARRPGFPRRVMAPEQHRQRVQQILRKLARSQVERPPAGGGGAEPGGEVPVPAEDKPTGKLSKEYIRASVREIVPLIKECYETALADDPQLSATLKVRFEIVADEEEGGLVADSRIADVDQKTSRGALAECVQETMYALSLPPPTGGGKVIVNYPFVFRNKGAKAPTKKKP